MDPIVEYGLFLGVGGLCLRQVQKFGPTRRLVKRFPGLAEFVECDLCLGSWLFMGLSLLWELRIRFVAEELRLLQLANVFFTGVVTAYAFHIVKLGLTQYALFVDWTKEEIDA